MRNFDEVVDRSQTEATKWERYRTEFQDDSYIPLWIADMDLPCSEAIEKALVKRAEHPIYGYTDRDKKYSELFAERFRTMHGYDIHADEIVLSTGVMYSITCALRMFSKAHDGVVVLSPCYHPFITAVENSERHILRSEMKWEKGRYEIDFNDLEEKLKKASVFLFCNPHNPTGRVFVREELERIAMLCERYEVVLISDEIHCDITYPKHPFLPIMMVNDYTKEHTIACVAPTKSFNIAGIKISAAIIKNQVWKQRFQKEASTIGISSINVFAMEAVKAAYLYSDIWQKELLSYLDDNRQYIEQFVKQELPKVKFQKPEGTYFYWFDFNAYQHAEQVHELLKTKAHVIVSDGEEFAAYSKGWIRLNFACPRPVLKEALVRIRDALRDEVMK